MPPGWHREGLTQEQQENVKLKILDLPLKISLKYVRKRCTFKEQKSILCSQRMVSALYFPGGWNNTQCLLEQHKLMRLLV